MYWHTRSAGRFRLDGRAWAHLGQTHPAWRVGAVLLACVGLALAAVRSIQASSEAVFTVTKTADTMDGACNADCSLREAIIAANATSGLDSIILPAGTYNLSRTGASEDAAATGDLDITADLTLIGAGAEATIIDGQGSDRIFQVIGPRTVHISGVTLRNGVAPSPQAGGAIQNAGILTLSSSLVTHNTATSSAGGGISNDLTLIVQDSTVLSNTTIFGGGIFNQSALTVTISNTTISENLADYGAGVYNKIGKVSVVGSLISDNRANGAGGGIDNFAGGQIAASASTISGNRATLFGGGIAIESGQLTLDSTTVNNNLVDSSSCGCDSKGGGIYNGGSATLTNSTLDGNTATVFNCPSSCNSLTAHGGGLFNAGPATLTNVTLSANRAFHYCTPTSTCEADGNNLHNESGSLHLKNSLIARACQGLLCAIVPYSNCANTASLISDGHNLEEGHSCGLLQPGDLQDKGPGLTPLQNNGGSTATRAPQPGSPAIDAGDNTGCPSQDQRAFPRPFDGDLNGSAVCDIGAVESGYRILIPVTLRAPGFFTGPCEAEPNNSWQQANGPLVLGQAYCGQHDPAQIAGQDELDYFSFTKGNGGTVTITVTGLLSNGTAQLSLYGPSGTLSLSFRASPPFQIVCSTLTPCSNGNVNTDPAGTYYVRIGTHVGYAGGPYSLVVLYTVP